MTTTVIKIIILMCAYIRFIIIITIQFYTYVECKIAKTKINRPTTISNCAQIL